jgi:Protein of unknown function (DUF4238)
MRHHYVPEFLSTPWTEGNANRELVEFRLKIPGVPTRRRSPKAIGFLPDLLALSKIEVRGIGQQSIETKLMQPVDTDAAIVRLKMLEHGLSALTISDRCDWVRFLTSLGARQPKFVEQRARIIGTQALLEVLASDPEQYRAIAQPDDPPTLEEFVRKHYPGLIEDFGLTVYPGVIDNKTIGEKVLKLTWIVRDLSSAKHELLLGDNPLISVGGLDAPSTLLALPLSPRQIFVACLSSETARAFERANSSVLVARANESTIQRAVDWVYARTDEPGRFIRNRIAVLRQAR